MQLPQSIFLVGPMGAGKTSVGQQLSTLLEKTFFDSDVAISTQCQLSITQIFAHHSESYFRQLEADFIKEVTRIPNIVLATGGGSIENSETRNLLRKHGIVIYLNVSAHEQQQRLKNAIDRPLLVSGVDLQYRDSWYHELANIIVETDHRTMQQVVSCVATELESLYACDPR